MTVSRLPSGRWRAQIWHQGRWVSVPKIVGGESSYKDKRSAVRAKNRAEDVLAQRGPESLTLKAFAERWATDPLFSRPKRSTNLHNAERVRGFVAKYGDYPLASIGDDEVAAWIAGGKNLGSVSSLRAMFNDAMSAKAGRLIRRNPFAGLGLRKTKGNRHAEPPTEAMVWDLIRAARKVAPPSFAAWLQVACFSGLRPGELDALRWTGVDLEVGWLHVKEQFSSKSGEFTLPKNGLRRSVPLTPPAREALVAVPREGSDFCFVNLRRTHWTASSRAYYWKAARGLAGWEGSLYLASRHFFGWYARNVLSLDSEDVAVAMGHTDGGELVRTLYGHLSQDMALHRVRQAFEQRDNVRPLPVTTREETA